MCNPGLPQTLLSSCLILLSAGIKGLPQLDHFIPLMNNGSGCLIMLLSKPAGASRTECTRKFHWKSIAAFCVLHSQVPDGKGGRSLSTAGCSLIPMHREHGNSHLSSPFLLPSSSSCILTHCSYLLVIHQMLIRCLHSTRPCALLPEQR